MKVIKTIPMNKHFRIEHRLNDGVKYRALIYINDNAVKYLKPLTNQTDESFMNHALQMIGWAQ